MPIYQAVVLALIQGFTEFLPISSSAHLFLVPWLLGWKDQGLDFDIALHLGTLFAVLVYFAKDWLQVTAQGFGLSWGNDPELKQAPRMLWYLALASVPAGIIGLLFKDTIENTLRSPYVMGSTLIGVGLVMLYAERFGKQGKHIGQMSLIDTFVVGAAQALALIPGTSRSGITITAGLFRGLSRASAARFSFLLSTPIVAASGAKALLDLRKHPLAPDMVAPFYIGIAVSGISGLIVVAFFLRFLRRHSLHSFIYYRIGFGILVIALALVRKGG